MNATAGGIDGISRCARDICIATAILFASHPVRIVARMDPLVRFALKVSFSFLLALPLLAQQQAPSQAPSSATNPAPQYQTLFYDNGKMRLEAYFYKPAGDGPFPLVVYNHGSNPGNERAEIPMLFISRPLRAAGYAVLVPERRG